ncbi:MAG: sodium:calcium antiporter, partial [Candidatus Aenigmarchaeota archaeon]|nr:sodium:calcium antiporter [Candidatus Aenigmarchaeota archaeon]
LVVMGIPSLFSTLYVTKSIIAVSLPMMVIFTLFFYFIVRDKEITQWEGMILIVFYLLFLGNIFGIM